MAAPIPYVRGPSQGVSQTYYNPYAQYGFANAQEYQDAVNRYMNPVNTQESLRQAQNAMAMARSGSRELGTPGVYGTQWGQGPGQVNISNLRQEFMANQNPEAMGGIANMRVGEDQFRILNPILQQAVFTDAYNQGRSNQVQGLLGLGQRAPQGMPYRSFDVGKQQLERQIYANPRLAQEGFINPIKQWESQQGQRYNQLQGLQRQMAQGVTEQRNVGGQVTGGTAQGVQNQMAVLQRQLREQNPVPYGETRGGRLRAQEQAQNALMMKAPQITPTYANLPIRETVTY